MRISDWSSDVCSSDLQMFVIPARALQEANRTNEMFDMLALRVQAYPTPETWNQSLRLVLANAGGDKAMSLDVFRLMQATDALRNRNEVAEYSAIAAEAAPPGEAVAAIAAAKRAGNGKAGHSNPADEWTSTRPYSGQQCESRMPASA